MSQVLEFRTVHNPFLPKLAWLCQMHRGQTEVLVEHGSGVEQGPGWFFEGAWAGDFESGAFLDAATFGTGARIGESEVTFTPPDHVLDRLYLIRDDTQLWISNSLPFLLTRTKTQLDPDISDYSSRFADIRWGLDHAQTYLPLAERGRVLVWSWHHLSISPDLEVTQRGKARLLEFSDYRSYVGALKSQLGAVMANAQDPGRRAAYEPLTTISSGYDSTAISALAAELGCREALTFPRSRGKIGKASVDDSGQDAAAALGLRCLMQDRLGYLEFDDLPEIETMGAGSELASARYDIAGRLLLTGYMGDSMWDRVPATDLTDLRWPIIAGHNFTELRLATGFVHVPVPFMGCRQHEEVIAVSQSSEMASWSLGTGYDRPICRRIAEERGVPGHVFGQTKRAAGVFFREEGLAATMTENSYADYTAYRLAHRPQAGWRTRLADGQLQAARVINGLLSRGTKVLSRLVRRRLTAPALSVQPGPKTEAALLFHWSQERLRGRYALRVPRDQRQPDDKIIGIAAE